MPILQILVETPAHSGLSGPLSYLSEQALAAGSLVRVPLGRRETLGVVWAEPAPTAPQADPTVTPPPLTSPAPPGKTHVLRPLASVLQGITPLSLPWLQLVEFAAVYYQRSLGEVALSALPPQLRDLDNAQLARKLKRSAVASAKSAKSAISPAPFNQSPTAVTHTPEQAAALAQIESGSGPFLLFGATGSGKTEVYLQAVQNLLAREPAAQALVLVPEINLTPQLEARFTERFAPLVGAAAVVPLHSGMTPAQRLASWLAAHNRQARIVLGTRLAVFASLPGLALIVVDEEHDPSYKQTEGARYSARDLAVWRGKNEGAKVILGSATPALESWYRSRPKAEGGSYQRLEMPSRVGAQKGAELGANAAAALPLVRRVDMHHQPKKAVIAPPLLAAIQQRATRGEQSLLLLNRRGYAPVLACAACDWKSQCPHCSAYRVFHKIDRSLRCHHCGFTEPVPRACPECGNLDINTVGRGTERLEEHLDELLNPRGPADPAAAVPTVAAIPVQAEPVEAPPQHPTPSKKLSILRMDADSTRLKGELERQLAQVHGGEVDVLVGTQMIAKGHDFRKVTLVAAINPDGALFSSDFRAPERLFSLLLQAAGRAGRAAETRSNSEVWIQSFYPQHPLFAFLKTHDYPGFAAQQLQERRQASLPPFSFQALLRAEARTQAVAQAFLNAVADAASALPDSPHVTLYPAVPLGVARVANVERAQLLVESPSRARLQRFLGGLQAVLHTTRQGPAGKGLIRWAVDVDPLVI